MRSTAFSRSGSKVMRSGFFAIGFAVAFLIAANAQAANSWGLPNEEIVRYEAKVVDVLCELSGDCPADGGAGRRQLGLVTDEDRKSRVWGTRVSVDVDPGGPRNIKKK